MFTTARVVTGGSAHRSTQPAHRSGRHSYRAAAEPGPARVGLGAAAVADRRSAGSPASRLEINQVRAEVLFASTLQRSENPTAAQVRAGIASAVRQFGSRGCATRMAQAFGDAPEAAVVRMRWARQAVAAVFPAGGPAARAVIGGDLPAWYRQAA
jgi:hypothetical protein